MPVLQGDQPAGDIIGGLLGAAGAFIGGQQQAKQQKAEQARQAALDAQTVAETLYRHAEDQKTDAREDVRAGQQATTFQEGQTTFQQGQEDRTHDQAVATALAQFQHKLQYPTNWSKLHPQQQIAYLQQRLNAAEQAGDKQTIQATKDEIESIQKPFIAAMNQAAANSRASGAQATARRDTDVRESGALNRLNIRVETGGRGGGGANSDLGGRGEAVENQAMGAPDLKSALRIVERANLPRRDRAEVRQDVMDQFRQPTAKDTSGLSNAGKEKFSHDMTAWTLGGMVGDQPDPSDPKYQRKSAAMGAAPSAPAPGGAPPPAAGKTVVGSDGHTYQQLPNGKWKVIK